MPWQNNLDDDANRNFAADERNETGATPDPALTRQDCPPCPVRLVVVEFAEKPASRTNFFLGARYQYVNLSSDALVGVDPAVTSAHQLGRTPPIVVKVTPPQAKTVTLRLVRVEGSHGFPGGSETLSAREQGLSHLTWPVATSSVTTDGNGDGKLDPGIRLSALAGFKYHVEGSIDGGPFMRSSNSVNIRRRLAIRPVVHHVAGQAAAFTAISNIRGDLEALDVEAFQTASATGAELGVREENELTTSLIDIGKNALDAPADVSVFKPHAVSIIVGEFITDPITPTTFQRVINRPAGGSFPASADVDLDNGTSTFLIVPLTNGSQLVAGDATVRFAGSPTEHPLLAAEVTGTNQFAGHVSVNLTRLVATAPTANRLTITVKVKAINGWAVGWAYNQHPVIYLNMRDPNSDGILTAEQVAALVIHETAHKLHLTSRGTGNAPDKQPHHYPSFSTALRSHTGPHCSTGVPAGTALDSDAALAAATCTMWGALKTIRAFCPECQTTLRKVDLSTGF